MAQKEITLVVTTPDDESDEMIKEIITDILQNRTNYDPEITNIQDVS